MEHFFRGWKGKGVAARRRVLHSFGVNADVLTDHYIRNLTDKQAFELWQTIVRRKLQEDPRTNVTERPGLKAGSIALLRDLENEPPSPPARKSRRGPRRGPRGK